MGFTYEFGTGGYQSVPVPVCVDLKDHERCGGHATHVSIPQWRDSWNLIIRIINKRTSSTNRPMTNHGYNDNPQQGVIKPVQGRGDFGYRGPGSSPSHGC